MSGEQGWKTYERVLAKERADAAPDKLVAKYVKARNASRADMVRLWRAGKLPIRMDFVKKYKLTRGDHAAMLTNFTGPELAMRIIALDEAGIDISGVTKTMARNRKTRKSDFDENEHVKYRAEEGEELTAQQREVNAALDEHEQYLAAKHARSLAGKKGTTVSASDMTSEERAYYNSLAQSKREIKIPEGTTRKLAEVDPQDRMC